MAAKTNRKSKAMSGVKALIATASVAATLAGWAILPGNDPQGSVSASQEGPPAAIITPAASDSGTADRPQSLDSLPQVSVPQSSGDRPHRSPARDHPGKTMKDVITEQIQQIEFKAMGSEIMAAVKSDRPEVNALLADVPRWFAEWEQAFSRFRPESELSRLNSSGSHRPVRQRHLMESTECSSERG